jgi:precorrin-3B methylase
MAKKRGSLVVVGTGIECFGQMTTGARAHLRAADKVLHVVADPLTEREIRRLNPRSESLRGLYATGKHRLATYAGMAQRMIDEVHKGHRVCAALYGHPGVFAMPAHAAIRILRDEGYSARMLPAVSADACMIADLGVDPATDGWQSYEATDFLLRERKVDPTSGLVLWQAGVVGCVDYPKGGVNRKNVKVLTDVLLETYPGRHMVTLYEAATIPGYPPVIEKFPLRNLPDSPLTSISTLYIPPARRAPVNRGLAKKLGLKKRALTACLR